MLLKTYSIRDSKAEIYNQPFFQRSHGEAERSFTTLVNDGKSTISEFPSDYDLYYIGNFDDQTGVMDSLDTPQHIQKAAHVSDKLKSVQ